MTPRLRIVFATAMLAVAGVTAACEENASGPQPNPHAGHGSFVAPSPAPLRAGERFVTLTMPKAYAPAAPNGGSDEYRCFLVDPGLTSMAYLTGSQFLPQNADIVHHAIFFRIAPDAVAKARQADARSSGEGWRCFGDAGIDADNDWVASWAPGSNEVPMAPGLGFEMPPGSRLVMQVHYNLLATGGRAGASDRSGIRLRLADGSVPMTALHTFLLLAPVELPCAAQEKGRLCERSAAVADVRHRFGDEVGDMAGSLVRRCSNGRPVPGPTQHCDVRVPAAATIYAAAGHMHLLGRSIKIEINPGTPKAVTVLDVPQYVFDNQAVQPLAKPLKVRRGDVLRVTCTHDVALRQMLPQLKPLPPRYVVWGDGTSDEMCLGMLVGTPS